MASNYAVPEVDAATWALQVTGLTEEKSFTLEDLKALPQTKKTIAFPCAANAIGSYQIGNVPVTGVLLSDLVEACGGAKEGVVAVGPNAADGWRFPSPRVRPPRSSSPEPERAGGANGSPGSTSTTPKCR